MQSTIIHFISNKPDEPIVPGGPAQTFDSLSLTILCLVLLFGISFAIYFVRKYKGVFSIKNIKGSAIENVGVSKKLFIISTSIVVSIILCASIIFASQNAFAGENNNPGKVTDKINAVVDYQTGEVSFNEAAYITGEAVHKLNFNSIKLSLLDGIDDNDCDWTISLDDAVIYENKAGHEEIFDIPFIIDKSETYTLSFTCNIDPLFTIKLVDKDVAKVEYDINYIFHTFSVEHLDPYLTQKAKDLLNQEPFKWLTTTDRWGDIIWYYNDVKEDDPISDYLSIWDQIMSDATLHDFSSSPHLFKGWDIFPHADEIIKDNYVVNPILSEVNQYQIISYYDIGQQFTGKVLYTVFDEQDKQISKVELEGPETKIELPRESKGKITASFIYDEKFYYGSVAYNTSDWIDAIRISAESTSLIKGNVGKENVGQTICYKIVDSPEGADKVFYSIVDAEGNYSLNVTPNSKGVISILNAQNFISHQKQSIITAPEISQELIYDFTIEKIDNQAYFKLKANNFKEVAIIDFAISEEDHIVSCITDIFNNTKLIALPANTKGVLTVFNRETITDNDKYYIAERETNEPGSVVDMTYDFLPEKAVFTIQIGESPNFGSYTGEVPAGWEYDESSHTLSKKFISNSQLTCLVKEFDTSKFVGPSGKTKFAYYSNIEGNLSYSGTTVTVKWASDENVAVNGKLVHETNDDYVNNVRVSFYDKNNASNNSFVYSNSNGEFVLYLPYGAEGNIQAEGFNGFTKNYCSATSLDLKVEGVTTLEDIVLYDKAKINYQFYLDPGAKSQITDIKFVYKSSDNLSVWILKDASTFNESAINNVTVPVMANKTGVISIEVNSDNWYCDTTFNVGNFELGSTNTYKFGLHNKSTKTLFTGSFGSGFNCSDISFAVDGGHTYTGSVDDSKFEIEVCSSSKGTIIANGQMNGNNCTYIHSFTSPNFGASTDLGTICNNSYLVKFNAGEGSFITENIPEDWSIESDKTIFKYYTDGTEVSLIVDVFSLDSPFSYEDFTKYLDEPDGKSFKELDCDTSQDLSDNLDINISYDYFINFSSDPVKYGDNVVGYVDVAGERENVKRGAYLKPFFDGYSVYNRDGSYACTISLNTIENETGYVYHVSKWDLSSGIYYLSGSLVEPCKFTPSVEQYGSQITIDLGDFVNDLSESEKELLLKSGVHYNSMYNTWLYMEHCNGDQTEKQTVYDFLHYNNITPEKEGWYFAQWLIPDFPCLWSGEKIDAHYIKA